ncbi:MAG: hypothetical protein D6695_04580, partial [Planctomycetota bacterium]
MIRLTFLTALALLSVLVGPVSCTTYTPGGVLMSIDRFTYVSTPYELYTIDLVDVRTGETIWTLDLPVGQRVTLQFYKNKSEGYADYPDVMRWEIQGADDLDGILRSQISVPDRWSRRLDVSLREPPGFYPDSRAQ